MRGDNLKAIIKFFVRLYYILFFRVEIRGIENWHNSPKIVCANHFSLHDGVLIASHAPEYLRYMGKKSLFKKWYLRIPLEYIGVFPVDRDANDLSAVKTTLRAIKAGESVAIFPEGTRNTTNRPLIAKGGIVMLAVKAKVPILPITIDSTYKLFSKIIITIHPVVDLSEHYGNKSNREIYQHIAQDIVELIYEDVKLFQGR